MLKKLYNNASVLSTGLASFRSQETIFIVLNLLLLALLLLLHLSLDSFWGTPSPALITVVTIAFLLRATELMWVQKRPTALTDKELRVLTWASIIFNLVLAAILAELTDHEDSPYYVLMVVPILECAFRASLLAVSGVILVAGSLNFFWVWRLFQRHPPVDAAEYLESGISSLVFALVGFLVWLLVKYLRQNESFLAKNLLELERTREKLLQEETLAAVGRLSSAIAHEIRNPVAMISSSLATATRGGLDGSDREEMFQIAAREASRLERLTDDFLSYARPRSPERSANSVLDTLAYVASVCRAHASQKQVPIEIEASPSLVANIDPAQVQQALLNLVMNAVDACPAGKKVWLKASSDGFAQVRIDVENPGGPIPQQVLSRIFEPFFTTKPKGTGLGLAIARNIARNHEGDLVLASNTAQRVCFSVMLPMTKAPASTKG